MSLNIAFLVDAFCGDFCYKLGVNAPSLFATKGSLRQNRDYQLFCCFLKPGVIFFCSLHFFSKINLHWWAGRTRDAAGCWMQNTCVERCFKSPLAWYVYTNTLHPCDCCSALSPPNWQLNGAHEAIKQWSGQTHCWRGSKGCRRHCCCWS